MVIIGLKFGQLANRLLTFSHFIANAIEHDYSLLNPTFGEFSGFFSSTSRNNFGNYHISIGSRIISLANRFLIPLMRKYFPRSYVHHFIEYHSSSGYYDLNDRSFLSEVKKKVVIPYGWPFRDYKNAKKYADTIRSFFEPVSPYKEHVEDLITQLRKECDILIGVHRRKGDYRDWRGGSFYYEDEVYRDKMMQIEAHFRKLGKVTVFLLCSDENIEVKSYPHLHISLGTNHFVEDLYSLSQCDYIIGPPSTYSMWASFYGNVPFLHIADAKQRIEMSQFRINCG